MPLLSIAVLTMKTSLLTFFCSLLLAFGFTSCVPIDPYYDGGGYPSGGSYGGGSYGNSYNDGYYSPRPSYQRPYGNSYGYGQSYHGHQCPICHRSNCSGHHSSSHSHHDHDDDDRRSNSKKNDTLYKYRGKNGPSGNHTIDWWHSRGYQRSQLDFAD